MKALLTGIICGGYAVGVIQTAILLSWMVLMVGASPVKVLWALVWPVFWVVVLRDGM